MAIIQKLSHGIAWRVRRVKRGCKRKVRGVFARCYKYYTRKKLYPSVYRKNAKRPVDEKKIVFLEVRMPQLTDSFRLIYDKLEKEYDYKLVFHSLGDGLQNRTAVRKNSLAALKDLADAKYIFLSDSCALTGCLEMRPETKVIQVWHACGAFKKFGFSTAEKIFGASKEELLKYPIHRNFSMVTVSSPEVAWAYAEAFHMEDRMDAIVPAGVSRTDVFYDPKRIEQAKEKLHRVMPESKGKKVILYAPTFRGRVAKAKSPDELDLALMQKTLGDEYVMVCKHHPFVKKRPEIPEEYSSFAKDVTEEMEIDELLMSADICISDYSSLIFEYSLFERPMIFFAYDLEDYFDWRGFYYNYDELTPGPVVSTTEEILDYITHLDERFDRSQVAAFKEKFMSACDGHATERILQMAGIERRS
ncbi:MAG: CDP-glycerol glycerophosphotransferase family protein [Eubacteriales bacterium]|nr:CDP-glycerol glycerophosphotransferase family protein [Eubacteriales bacterium]